MTIPPPSFRSGAIRGGAPALPRRPSTLSRKEGVTEASGVLTFREWYQVNLPSSSCTPPRCPTQEYEGDQEASGVKSGVHEIALAVAQRSPSGALAAMFVDLF